MPTEDPATILKYARDASRLALEIGAKDRDMDVIVKDVARATANVSLASWCLSQVPQSVRDKYECKVETDAYMLRPIARFAIKGTTIVFECKLEAYTLEGEDLDLKVPDEFIAKLCTAV
jgi:hypothetical protein